MVEKYELHDFIMAKSIKNISFFDKLKKKYRLVIINDDSFEQKYSIKLTKFNIYIGAGSVLIFIIALVLSMLAFTNLKYYLPGVGKIDFRNKINLLHHQTDSLQDVLNQRNLWINNVQKIVAGDIDSSYYFNEEKTNVLNVDSIDLSYIPKEDRALRAEVERKFKLNEQESKLNISAKDNVNEVFPLVSEKFIYTSPIEGLLLKAFSIEENHFGVDIAGKKDQTIKAIYDGTVVISEWNPKTGNVIAIQHPGNTISFYKHNSLLLKKRGTFVKKGDIIAIVGNSGKLSSGPHLHFELWRNGKVLNPEKFLNFKKLN